MTEFNLDPREREPDFYWLSKHPWETGDACLWLDDTREAPPGWDRCYTAADAILALNNKVYKIASLDHDLEYAQGHNGQTGYTVVDWMAKHDVWPTEAVYVHSWNIYCAESMCSMINQRGPYKKIVTPTPANSWPE